MKLPILSDTESLCDQCVALCCRYFALEIDAPKVLRDFEDIRWYMLHEDVIAFVEDGEWYLQVNRKCNQLLPDNRCGIYHNRPEICREYTTEECDWHAEEYEYEHLFTEPDQIQAYAKKVLAEKKKKTATKTTASKAAATKAPRKKATHKKVGKARQGHAHGAHPLAVKRDKSGKA